MLFASDDDTPASSLIFHLVSQSNPAVVQLQVEASGRLSATVMGEYAGRSWITLSATDAHGNVSETLLEVVVGRATDVPVAGWNRLR